MDSEGSSRYKSNSLFAYSSKMVNECESLLIEIFARLDCREAVKLKLVCKHWNSIISSYYFVTAFNHRRHDPSLPPIPQDPSYRLVFQFLHRLAAQNPEYEYSSIVHCGSNSQPLLRRSLDLDFLPFRPMSRIAVVASSADLILFAFMSNPNKSQFTNYVVCNVQTKQWFALPPPPDPHDILYSAIGFLCIPSPCSLCEGVDSSRYKFVVLRVQGGGQDGPDSILLKVELFSSEEGEWRKHELSSPLKYLTQKGKMVPYKGMLHWLNFPHVVVFDQYGQISRVINWFRCCPRISSFDVHQDRLRLVNILTGMPGYDAYCCIWELEDYDGGRWSCVKKFGGAGELGVGYVHPDGNAAYCTDDQEDGNTCIWFQNLLSDHKIKLVTDYEGAKNVLLVSNVHRVVDQGWPTPVPSLGT